MKDEKVNFEFSRYEKNYSEDGFWDKMKSFAKKAGTKVVYSALKLYYAAQSPDTPAWAKSVIYGALGYLILPVDAIPDVLPAVGFTDDFAMIATAMALIAANITDDVKNKADAKMRVWFNDFEVENVDDNTDEQ